MTTVPDRACSVQSASLRPFYGCLPAPPLPDAPMLPTRSVSVYLESPLNTIPYHPFPVGLADAAIHPTLPWTSSCFFRLLPLELRLIVYEFVFTWCPIDDSDRVRPSHILRPLLTCHQFHYEASRPAFKAMTHYLLFENLLTTTYRLRVLLRPSLAASIRHIAIRTSANQFHNNFHPIRLHLDHLTRPFLTLTSLTIFLEPTDSDRDCKQRAMKEIHMILTAIYYVKNVSKIIVSNIVHGDTFDQKAWDGEWSLLGRSDSPSIALRRWRYKQTNFYSWPLKPWQ